MESREVVILRELSRGCRSCRVSRHLVVKHSPEAYGRIGEEDEDEKSLDVLQAHTSVQACTVYHQSSRNFGKVTIVRPFEAYYNEFYISVVRIRSYENPKCCYIAQLCGIDERR